MTNQSNPIHQTTDDENISYSLYDQGNGEATYLVRDEDADQTIARANGPIEALTIRYEVDTEAIR
jgi:hypothetical protein